MSNDICIFQHNAINGGGECGQDRFGGDHNADYHAECVGADASNCMLHEFTAGEPQHVLDARKVREAAMLVADLAPPLAEALHLRAQDIFEAGEKAANGVYAIKTVNSVYLADVLNGAWRVLSRTSLEGHGWLDNAAAYSGPVIGKSPTVGSRFSFVWSEDPSRGPINVSQVRSITRLP